MNRFTLTRRELNTGVELIHINADKFKSGSLALLTLSQHDYEHASLNALLPNVLVRGSRNYPDIESLQNAYNNLYGMSLSGITSLYGEIMCSGLYNLFPDDKFLPGEDSLLEDAFSLFGEILLEPATENGFLREDYVAQEKDKQIERIEANIDNKINYSLLRLEEEMFRGENTGAYVGGSIEKTNEITPESLTAHYRELLGSSEIKIIYCGSAGIDRVAAALGSILTKLPRTGALTHPVTQIVSKSGEPRYITEEADVTQGNLVMGYRIGDVNIEEQPVFALFSDIYGNTPVSKLFTNVREKLSLCYFASVGAVPPKGVFFVISGIAFEKYDEALGEIMAQLESVKSGDISDMEIMIAKMLETSSLKTVADSPSGLLNYYFMCAIGGFDWSPDEYAERINNVTAAEVAEFARRAKLDTVFWLCGKETEGSNHDNI